MFIPCRGSNFRPFACISSFYLVFELELETKAKSNSKIEIIKRPSKRKLDFPTRQDEEKEDIIHGQESVLSTFEKSQQ
jgi:hypothetical protein